MSRRRCFGSLVRQRSRSRRIAAGVSAGSADQSGSRSRIFAIESEVVSPPNVAAAGQHLVQHAPEGPDVGALVHRQAARLLGTHVRGRADDRAVARPVASGGALDRSGDEPSPATALARPKSSTFTTPSGVILMFAGFRSRWTMPLSWAASSASAICRAMRQRLAEGQSAAVRVRRASRGEAVGERVALDELENQEANAVRFLEAVDRADVGVVQRRRASAPRARSARGVQGGS